MTSKPNNLEVPKVDLDEIVEQLLEESFAIAYSFASLSIEEAGKAIEDAREAFDQAEDEQAGDKADRESYYRCVEFFCTILLEMDGRGLPLPLETLGEMVKDHDQRTQVTVPNKPKSIPKPPPIPTSAKFAQRSVPGSRIPAPEMWGSKPAAPVTIAAAPPAPEPGEEASAPQVNRDAGVDEIWNELTAQAAPTPESDEEILQPSFEKAPPAKLILNTLDENEFAPLADDEKDTASAQGDTFLSYEAAKPAAKNEDALFDIGGDGKSDGDDLLDFGSDLSSGGGDDLLGGLDTESSPTPKAKPEKEPDLLKDEQLSQWVAESPMEIARIEEAEMENARALALETPPSALTCVLAEEYWQLAHFLKGMNDRGRWPLPPAHITKLVAQGLCFALESECALRFEKAIKSFWSKREVAIRGVLDEGNRKFELGPALRNAIDQAAGDHTEWLLEGKFPHAAVLTSLRYMIATIQAEKFQPSLIESGILVFFFGQETTFGELSLKNHLDVSGLEPNEMTEFLFRMSRLHRLRSRVVSATQDFETGQLLIVEQDVHAILAFFERLKIGPEEIEDAA